MTRTLRQTMLAALLFASVLDAASAVPNSETVTWTGWFSDKRCATQRVERGEIGPNNPECVKRCLDEGVAPVFISEQARALYEVTGYPAVADDLGYHIELTGTVDESARRIAVERVTRLEYVGSQCALPKKSK
jgi:hypothetical protein